MKYASKKLPDSIVEIEATLDHKEFLEYYQPVYDQALSSVHLKGFRPGTAPKEMAEKAVDKEKVFNEAVNKAVRDALQEITEENNWQLIDQPKVEINETDLAKNLGIKFKVTLSVFPEVKLGNYEKIAKRVLSERKEVLVSEDEFQKSVNWVLGSRAKIVKADREAKKGDLVKIEFSSNIGTPDVQNIDVANLETSGVPKLEKDTFILGEGKFITGFEENIVGHKAGENLEFSVNFPKDYWKEDLRDKKVDFKVKVGEVFVRQLPELNDEFAKGLGKFENAEALKKSLKEGLIKEKESKEKERLHIKIMEEIIKDSKIEFPKVMVDKALDNLVNEYKAYVPAGKEDDSALRERFQEKAKNNTPEDK